jgi:hypothetical protein
MKSEKSRRPIPSGGRLKETECFLNGTSSYNYFSYLSFLKYFFVVVVVPFGSEFLGCVTLRNARNPTLFNKSSTMNMEHKTSLPITNK